MDYTLIMSQASEAARILGKIKTMKKAMAARINGCMPCRKGKKRGRPKGKVVK